MPAPTRDAINLSTVDFLFSPVGRAAAAELNAVDLDDTALAARLDDLRRRFAPEQAGALLALARLRRRAAAKFPAANRLFFTAEALEQATAHTVAAARAAWIHAYAPPGPVLDLGCGIGGDTLALAALRPVVAYESDPLRLRLAQANADALGLGKRVTFHGEDWVVELAEGRLPPATAAFLDPPRRQDGRRIYRLDDLDPPPDVWLELQDLVPALSIKVMPGVDEDDIPPGASIQFVSHTGVCKEAVLWFGPLARYPVWASVHTPAGWQTLVSWGAPPPLGDIRPGMALHEPDPAVIRAGAFFELCERLDAHLFDAQIAYLVGPPDRTDPLVQSFRILEIHRFSLKLLQERLAALGMTQVELKKRGAPFAPESLRGRLKLGTGGRAGVVIFTRREDDRIMILAERV
jgi:predicted O-methyltransferase YrrM